MDFENVYKSRKNILKMLKLRNFDTEIYDAQTKEELNILFQQHTKKMNYDIDVLDIKLTNEEHSILVKYILKDKVRSKDIEKQITSIYDKDLDPEDTFIVISKDKVNYNASLKDFILRNYSSDNKFIQIFHLNNFLFDITEHCLCPKYRILNEEERDALLKKYNTIDKHLPNIKLTDALGSFYGIKLNEIVEITDNSPTSGIYTSYRLCVS